MAKYKIVLNRRGVRQLLRSKEMKNICAERAEQIARRCGEGYESDAYTGKNRVNAAVYADTYQAKADNARNNTILKALK